MIRFLLVLVSLLIAVLAFALDRPWLYAVAGVPLVGALGLLGRQLWTAYQREAGGTSPPNNPPLEDLGIMDVRPHDRQGGSNGSSVSESGSPSTSETAEINDGERTGGRSTAQGGPATAAPDEVGSDSAIQTAPETATDVQAEEQPVLGPFLESLRAALGARTVGLFVQEEVILEYRIEACASTEPAAQQRGTFETQSPLLTATMSRQPVTVRRVDADDRTNLGYYGTPPAIEQIALAPVPQPDSASTVFLLADATAEVDLGASHARSLLERYADTIGMLRDTDASALDPSEDAPNETSPASSEASEEKADQPRPRREIIAEEMTAADAGDDDLALVLVHLNRAESIARRGQEAVATAEHLLRTRLEHFAPGQRVERFGELTYGLFPRQGLDEVETWAADLQDAMAEETGELEGGVSVGVAVRSPRHDAQELRADATEALREAYETGTCTIVA